MTIAIKTLVNIDVTELLDVFNKAFSDYFVPLQLTMDQLKAKLISDKVRWEYSVGAFTNDALVGFILHGFDVIDNKKVVYNGGTGVIPNHRKNGLTKQMYDFILPILKSDEIDTLLLEVITQNVPAITSYEKVGYHIDRKLNCYKGGIHATINKDIRITALSDYDWKTLQSFWDFEPSWQNSSMVLEEQKQILESYGAYIGAELVGYIVYNPLSKRVQQFAVNPKFRRKKIGSTLFDYISTKFNAPLTLINIDESSTATNAFLEKIGLENFIAQYEMRMEKKVMSEE